MMRKTWKEINGDSSSFIELQKYVKEKILGIC